MLAGATQTLYDFKKKWRGILSCLPVEPDVEHTLRAPGAEQGGISPPQVKLKDRQKFFEEAFQQDMEQYLSTGYLQIAERRGEEEEESFFQESLSGALRIPAAWTNFSIPCVPKKEIE